MDTKSKEEIRNIVRQKYAKAITSKGGCGCGDTSCCSSTQDKATQTITGNLYAPGDMEGISQELIETSLGCGNPTAMTPLHAGEVVLDLGSGAGLDVLLSARRVGPAGKAYGLDMTDEMLAAASANKAKLGIVNAEFLKGHIENIPLPDNSVDVVISNCVINLSADKEAVFREIHRVLKPGGRMAVSDTVLLKTMPDWLQQKLSAWTGCITGALSMDDFKKHLSAAGFTDSSVELTRVYDPKDLGLDPLETKDAIGSAFVRARKEAKILQAGTDYLIRKAESNDFQTLHELLTISHLTTAGVDPATGDYFIAISQGRLLGMVGYEKYGTSALLRSFSVRPEFRKFGLGSALVKHLLKLLKEQRLSPVFLLTNTAEQYFAQFGFVKINRQEIPTTVLESSALGSSCPASSTCMKLG